MGGTASLLESQDTVKGRTFLSVGGGLSLGPGELWNLPRQPIINPNLRPPTGGEPFVDSLFVSQSVDAGSAFLLSVTNYPSENFGLGTDLAYSGFRSSVDCSVVFNSIDDPRGALNQNVTSPNSSACDDARSKQRDAITFDIAPFIAWRVLPNAEITPVLKASGGLSVGPCTVRVRSFVRELVEAPCSSALRPTFSGTFGLYRQTDVEAQFHFEVRYSVRRWDSLDGPPDNTGMGNSTTIWKGGLGFSMGIDFQV